MRERHPLLHPPLSEPALREEALEVTIIIRRSRETLTAVFSGDDLATGVSANDFTENDDDPNFGRLVGNGPLLSDCRHFDLRLDITDASTCTFISTSNATQEENQ
jgi:hypothetical protein